MCKVPYKRTQRLVNINMRDKVVCHPSIYSPPPPFFSPVSRVRVQSWNFERKKNKTKYICARKVIECVRCMSPIHSLIMPIKA